MSSFLEKHKRQPKIFIDLPSNGQFYDESVIQDQQYTQLPVFGMNTMDEIMLKTPDALFSGESTAKIIQSCIPLIKDPWRIVGFDLDYILLAIRMATYGNSMPITTQCPKCNEETGSDVQLQVMMDKIDGGILTNKVDIKGLTFHLQPLTYKVSTEFSKKHFTLQKQLTHIEATSLIESEKQVQRQEVIDQLSQLNIYLSIAHVANITKGDESESDPAAIRSFVADNDAEVYAQLKDGVTEMNVMWNKEILDIKCGNEECGHEYKSELNVDYSSFFGTRSLRSRNLNY